MARYIIVGGVAGGATTAARLRRNSETAEIIMFERGPYISYANCGLPYYIGGVIPERDRLFVQTPESFRARFNVDIRVNTEVISINRNGKTVTVRDLAAGKEYTEAYDALVLSPGAEPVKPRIPGIDLDGIFTLRNVSDTDRIHRWVHERHPARAVVVGGGFIGLETAENLHRLGIKVSVVEALDQVMAVLDFEMAAIVHEHLAVQNVDLYLKDGVSSFENADGLIRTTLSGGRTIDADMVVLSIGVKPDTQLAREAGLRVGKTGGIVVDQFLRTDDQDIYALGDAIEFTNPVTGRPAIIPLAGPANRQGRIVADNLAFGPTRAYKGSIGTAIARVFDLTVASTGVSEKVLKREGMAYKAVITHSGSHAGYYPDSKQLTIKTLFDPDSGKLLGAQVVGSDGVDKRIDLIASVLGSGGMVVDLTEIEHAYAPPYSSAKDPVNIAGFVAENVVTGTSVHTQWYELPSLQAAGAAVLDVRTAGEFALGAIPGAVNIPIDELRSRLSEVPVDRHIVITCGVGLRAYIAERILRANGRTDVSNLSGGFRTWSIATGEQSHKDALSGDASDSSDTPAAVSR